MNNLHVFLVDSIFELRVLNSFCNKST